MEGAYLAQSVIIASIFSQTVALGDRHGIPGGWLQRHGTDISWVLLEPSAIGLLAGAALLMVYVKTNGRRIKEDMEELDP